jgi:hypothetical protein
MRDEKEHCAAHPAVYHASGKIQSTPLRSGGIVARLYSGDGRSRKLFTRIVYGMGIAAALLAMVAGLVCLIMFSSLLHAKQIDRHYGYFSSASPAFLQLLPEPPPGMIIPR